MSACLRLVPVLQLEMGFGVFSLVLLQPVGTQWRGGVAAASLQPPSCQLRSNPATNNWSAHHPYRTNHNKLHMQARIFQIYGACGLLVQTVVLRTLLG